MIRKDAFGTYEIVCDECGETADDVFNTFEEAVEYKTTAAEADGWRSVKAYTGEWLTLCPACATPEFLKMLKGGAA